jgi:hypothetical protein
LQVDAVVAEKNLISALAAFGLSEPCTSFVDGLYKIGAISWLSNDINRLTTGLGVPVLC